MGESKEERRKWEGREATQREHRRKNLTREAGLPAEVRVQLSTLGEILEDALGSVLDAGEPVKLIVEPDGRGGARFTLKTVRGVSAARRGVYLHGVVKHEADVSEALRRVIQKGDWREDQYWRP